jgi:hypothetical protein
MRQIISRIIFITILLSMQALNACAPSAGPTPASSPIEVAQSPTSPPAPPSPELTNTTEPTLEPTTTEEPTMEPTVDADYQEIVGYFQVIDLNQCRKVEDGSADTLVTVRCDFSGIGIDFDKYANSTKMNEFMDFVKSEFPSGEERNWTDNCTSKVGGKIYTYMELDGSAWFIWSVNSRYLTGTAIREDGDMGSIESWWNMEGVTHPCP